ncbi:MAG: right-handed parallel beta-helix repeat-containing protein [Kiritimatiellia bacterium]|jgi:hypothetical protein
MFKPLVLVGASAVASVAVAAVDPVAYVRDELARGVKTVCVPRGRYEVSPKGPYVFYLKGLRDVTIDFSGSELVGKVKTCMFQLDSCTNVVLRNVVIDYDPLPFTQARIEEVGPNGEWTVRVIDGYPRPRGEELENDFWPIQAYDPKTGEVVNPMRFRDGTRIDETGDGVYRIVGGLDRRGRVGDVAVWSVKDKTQPVVAGTINSACCVGCLFEDITEYATPHGCAYFEASATANVYRRCRIVRRDPEDDPIRRGERRFRSGNHDAFNSRCSFVGPVIEQCRFEYHCDDCVNISGYYALVTGQEDDTVRCVCISSRPFEVGDVCQVMTFDGECPQDVRVLSVAGDGAAGESDVKFFESLSLWPGLANLCRHAFKVRLAGSVGLKPGDALISSRRMGNGFAIRDCVFGHARANGVLIKASCGFIERNTISACVGSAVRLSPEYEWTEGGCSRDIVIRDNVLQDNGAFGIDISGYNGSREPLAAESHFNFTVVGNRIAGLGTGVRISGCTGLVLVGNSVEVKDGRSPGYLLENVASVTSDVDVEKNGKQE